MIRAGELDRVGQFFRFVETGRNALNEPQTQRQPLMRAMLRRRDVSDKERVQAGREAALRLARFVVLSIEATRQITTQDELDCDGRTWSIEGIKDLYEGRDRYLEITAVSFPETDT